jgi:hypothetical protein
MTQRNQIGRAFRALNRGDPRDAEHVAFLCLAVADQRERRGQHPDRAACNRDALRFLLAADVDHMRMAGGVEVGKS